MSAAWELLLLSALLSAVLFWRVARRLGLGQGAASIGIVLAALPLLFAATALLCVPAQLAVPWSLAATWGATAHRRVLRGLLALPALAVAALLAPVVLVPALAAAAVALFPAGRTARHPARAAEAAGLGAAAAVVAGLLAAGHLGPETTRPTAAAAAMPTAAALGAVACFLLVGGLAAITLSAFRVPAMALVAGSLAALLPLDRLAMILVCLPLAALLTAALVTGLTDELVERNPGASGAPRGPSELSRWPVSRRSASSRWAAGRDRHHRPAEPKSCPLDPRRAPRARRSSCRRWNGPRWSAQAPTRSRSACTGRPAIRSSRSSTAPPAGCRRPDCIPDSPGRPVLSLIDRRPGVPTAAELAQRHALAAAILANPTTTTGPRAAAVLRAASIDQRLLTVLAGLAAQFGVGVRDLPPADGEPSGMLPATP